MGFSGSTITYDLIGVFFDELVHGVILNIVFCHEITMLSE